MKIPNSEILYKDYEEILSDIQGENLKILASYAKKKNSQLVVDSTFEYLMFKVLGRSLMRGYKEIPRLKPLPKVLIEIIDKNELNAYAIKTEIENTYIIFVCKRLITDINLFIDELINCKNNPERERHKNDKSWIRGLFHQLILEHELSHIFNGHLDYLSNEFDLGSIEEKSNSKIKKEIRFIKQTLEMDADCCGLSRIYGWLNNLSKSKLPKEFEQFSSIESRNLVTSYSDVIMCFYILNKFYFDLIELNEEIGQTGKQTPRERVMGSFGNLILYIKTFRININLKMLMVEINRKLKLVEEIFYQVYGTPKNEELWTNKNYFRETDVTIDILMNWENIQPILSKYNYIPIAERKRN